MGPQTTLKEIDSQENDSDNLEDVSDDDEPVTVVDFSRSGYENDDAVAAHETAYTYV